MAFIIKDDKIIGLTEYGKDLKEIVIPSFVKEIGKSAFRVPGSAGRWLPAALTLHGWRWKSWASAP